MASDTKAPTTTSSTGRKPFFYDVTLRDGNQALRQPWNLAEKEQVFQQLLKLGVQGIEIGFAGASDMDFLACEHLAKMAPDNVVISSLARAVPKDIERAWDAVKYAKQPRIHTFITTSRHNMEHVLRMAPEQVKQRAVDAVKKIRDLMGGRGSIQFSAEHFGDCADNMDFVLDVFHAVIEAGATVINLPNTVERYRPKIFVDMVETVVKALPKHITVAVHTHNDLGMATATTVESFFTGATQLECALNGLGERAGNTNLYEVACALYNCGENVPLKMDCIYESALLVSEWAQVPLYEKAPLVGLDVVAHRSGIHQDGAAKTKGLEKGAYRAISGNLIGRKESDRLVFTSQSGKSAIFEIVRDLGLPISMEEAASLQPVLKKMSEGNGKGELADADIVKAYESEILKVSGPLEFIDITMSPHEETFTFDVRWNGETKKLVGSGTGPIDACVKAMESIGQFFHLVDYRQVALNVERGEFAADAASEIRIQKRANKDGALLGPVVHGRGVDKDTIKANIRALFNGMNLLIRK
jgi:2-isopropylmalate synthase